MITSVQNGMIKDIVALKSAKGRKKQQRFFVEGIKTLEELDDSWQVPYVLQSEDNEDELSREFKEAHSEYQHTMVSAQVFKHISDTVTPQGILAVVEQKQYSYMDLVEEENPFFILLEKVQDPGNIGTIIRTADAAGATGVLISEDSADIYNPKIVRATMGSLFHLPVVQKVKLEQVIETLKDKGIGVYAAHLKGSEYPYAMDFSKGTALLIGNEGKGLTEDMANLASHYVKLPMLGQAESLNAAVAASILSYEVVRQRLK